MSVIKMKASEGEARAHSGGGMDRVVEKKGLSRNLKLAIGGAIALVAAASFYTMAPDASSQTIAADRVTISNVEKGRFDDFLPLRARVTPLVSVYLDAVEGGRVEQVLVEDGAMVQKGQLLAVLSNSDLQLNLLGRQTEVSREVNSMRSQELALAQTQMQDERSVIEAELAAEKAKRQYEVQRPLADKGFVPAKVFRDSRDEYLSMQKRADVLRRARAVNQRLQTSQLAQLRASNASLSGSLDIARATLDALNLRAPVTGQLTAFSIQVGQSMNRGERLGQIDSAGRNKLVAQVDEFYLGRVEPGQTATAEWGGKTYKMKVAKIYPQVRNGTFEVDFHFVGGEPGDIQRGQTIQTKLTLGDPTAALLLPNGAFYNETGGAWVFVVTPDGGEAIKRQVRLGRRNADFIEVLEGLEPGEKVLTSPYTGFADKDRLDLETN
ncbi:efflux RND transporter periplasmic adaptor subunit [Sphingosinicella sp. LY1275]|uniref:efflux RND transporter periplasmic adaptor subunit n=1 Tax=Sphingosinicella sp. LY1275 TaxID=3095379 RepID=UPI002ADEF814|nr:efflux RND transporter periplasmic adaptor subunit [Sphingosinicella sp. LY1275]MEA1014022.1 efflux RND transporter periplasmic adaptor subunit [Sphingosinicella sp. LY1275]